MKIIKLLLPLCVGYILANGQEKVEQLQIEWPREYEWQIVSQQDDSAQMSTIIIPGYENTNNATIMGTMRVMKAVRLSNTNEMLAHYRSHLDSGSVLTVLDKLEKGSHHWVLFKVETPVTSKYPIAESDLYIVIQGDYGLYENYVAIKESSLSKDFIRKWAKVLKSGKFISQ